MHLKSEFKNHVDLLDVSDYITESPALLRHEEDDCVNAMCHAHPMAQSSGESWL